MATGPAAIRYILANDPDVSAVVGDRIYPDWLCQDAVMPAITLWAVSSTPFDTMTPPEIIVYCCNRRRRQGIDRVLNALSQAGVTNITLH